MDIHRRTLVSLLPALLVAAAAQAQAPATRPAVAADADALVCARAPGKCPRFRHVLSFPAHALSRSSFGSFALHTRGVNWNGRDGALSLTMVRPKDFAGNRIRLRFFYEVLDDGAGDIELLVTPVSLRHGSGFETYGSVGTGAIAAPESLTILHEQSVIVTSGSGWNPVGGPWWYFEITRQGSFAGGLRLMAVAVEY